MIEVCDASFAYEDSDPLLCGVSLAIQPGEILALVGRNGSGKSTLGTLVSGSLVPSSGEVLVDGLAAQSRNAWPLVGVVQQDPSTQMVSSLVEDEVAFGPRNLGLTEAEVQRRVTKALRACELGDFRGRSVERLSGGELQRLALADALALEPRYLVCDEAGSQLDSVGRASFSHLLDELRSHGMGVLLISHLLEQVVLATRVALLEAGHVVWSGTPLELLVSDELLAKSGLESDPLARPFQVLARAGFSDFTSDGRLNIADAATFAQEKGIVSELEQAVAQGLAPGTKGVAPSAGRPVSKGVAPNSASSNNIAKKGAAPECRGVALTVAEGRRVVPDSGGTEPTATQVSTTLRDSVVRASIEQCALQLEDVSVWYEGAERPALSHAQLCFEPGELTLVAGCSGSGKSTLARVAAGVLQPDEGSAVLVRRPVGVNGFSAEVESATSGSKQLQNQHVRAQGNAFGEPSTKRESTPDTSSRPAISQSSAESPISAKSPVRRIVHPGDVGLSFQRPEEQLFASTVLEDVAYGPKNQGANASDALENAREALLHLGVREELWERSPFDLSGGEQRRVALAGILALNCPAYVFDEPTAGLDGPSRALLHEVVDALRSAGCAVVVVSHDVDEWLPRANKVVLLREGHVVYRGPASACRANLAPFERAGITPPVLVQLDAALRANAQEPGSRLTRAVQSSGMFPAIDSDKTMPHKGSRDVEVPSRFQDGPMPEGNRRPRPHAPARTGGARRIALPVGAYIPRQTPFHGLDARVKLLLVLALTVATFVAPMPASLCVLLLAVLVCQRGAGVSARALVRSLKPAVVVLAFALVANALRLDGSGDIALLGFLGLSSAGLLRGAMAVMRIVTVVAGVLVVSASTTGPQIADALGRLLRPLGKLGIPTGDLSMILSVALRFLPQSVQTFDQIHAAQQARGAKFAEGGLSQRLSRWVAVLVPMVVALFRRADELAQAMRDRCYGYAPLATAPVRLRACDWAGLLAGCTFMLFICLFGAC